IIVSNNSWITNKIGVEWLKYFIKYIEGRKVRVYYLLIFNSYKSYNLVNFQDIYKENNIYTLYILPYLLHLLQLLNIGYFLLLKYTYRY
ncbi:hypothetical protein P154DRAFT_427179, partial [Amniculicola lignicola CBS 123094]